MMAMITTTRTTTTAATAAIIMVIFRLLASSSSGDGAVDDVGLGVGEAVEGSTGALMLTTPKSLSC